MKFKYNEITNKYICPNCEKEFSKYGINTHYWKVHTEQGLNFDPNIGYKNGSRTVWNKGLNKTDERVKNQGLNISKKLKEKFKNGEGGGFCSIEFQEYMKTKEYKEKQSEIMLNAVKKNPNSYDKYKVSGRVKNYKKTFNDVEMTFKGTWELIVAEFLFEKNFNFTNELDPIEYIWSEDNKKHLYFPDFYLPDYNKYIEVKGFVRQRDKDKWSSIDKENLIILYAEDIKRIKNKTFEFIL